MLKSFFTIVAFALAFLLVSCQGSKSSSDNSTNSKVSHYFISSIDMSTEIVYTDALVDLSYTTYGSFPSNLTATWNIDGGSFVSSTPELWQQVRGTRSVSTSATGPKVSLLAPDVPTTLKISVEFNDEAKTHYEREVTVYATPIKLVSTTETATGNVILTAKTSNVKSLYQIAFRVMFDPDKYTFDRINSGNFFPASERLFMGHQVDDGTVAVALSLKGAVAGKNGSGDLATLVLKPIFKSASSGYWLSLEAARNPEGIKVVSEY